MGVALIILAAITLPFLAVAIVFFAIGLRATHQAKASRGWTSTTGVVTASGVVQGTSSGASGHYARGYFPSVTYAYEVRGQHYQGDRIWFGGRSNSGGYAGAAATAARYPLGTPVRVYYDPQNPSEAVLERTARSGRIFIYIALLILLTLVGTVALLLALGFPWT